MADSPAFIKILSATSGFDSTCSDPGSNPVMSVNVNLGTGNSNNFTISAPGFAGFSSTSNNGPIAGNSLPWGFGYPYDWQFGFVIPPNTLITGSINVFSGLNGSGSVIYKSSIVWNCTTGVISSITNTDLTSPLTSPVSVPTLSSMMMLILASSIILIALFGLNRNHFKKY